MTDMEEIFVVLMLKPRGRPLIVGAFDSEEKRSLAIKEYFDSKRISAVMGYTDAGDVMYTLPKNNKLFYQKIKLNDKIRDNRH